jgi:hypothetical protein
VVRRRWRGFRSSTRPLWGMPSRLCNASGVSNWAPMMPLENYVEKSRGRRHSRRLRRPDCTVIIRKDELVARSSAAESSTLWRRHSAGSFRRMTRPRSFRSFNGPTILHDRDTKYNTYKIRSRQRMAEERYATQPGNRDTRLGIADDCLLSPGGRSWTLAPMSRARK